MSVFQAALLWAKASVVAVVFSTNTIFTALFAVLILREKFSWGAGAAIVMGLVGVACIMNPFAMSPDWRGIGMSLGSAVLFALYGVLGTRRVARYGGFIMNSASFLIGAVLMLPFMLLFRVPVVAGIDSGNLIATERTPLTGEERLTDLHIKVMDHAHDLYLRCIRRFASGESLPNIPQAELGEGQLFLSRQWTTKAIALAVANFYRHYRSDASAPPKRPIRLISQSEDV
jgi:threonine/homoserine efflux transporter RhtA